MNLEKKHGRQVDRSTGSQARTLKVIEMRHKMFEDIHVHRDYTFNIGDGSRDRQVDRLPGEIFEGY